MQSHGKHRGFPFEIFRLIILWESDVHVFGLAELHPDDLLLESRDKGMRAERQIVILRAAAIELFTVRFARKIDAHGIAVFGGSVGDFHLFRKAVARALDIFFHVGVRNSILYFFDFYTLVSLDLYIRFYGNRRRKNDFFIGQIFYRKRGIAYGREIRLFLFQHFAVVLRI